MTAGEKYRLEGRAGLSPGELEAIGAFEVICNGYEELAIKFSWELMRARPGDRVSDFLVFDGDALVGYAALDEFGGEAELTGMVHPEHRRRGIGSRLLDAAGAECREREVAQLLLVCEHASGSGQAFVAARGERLRYDFSEFHLERDATPDDPPPPAGPLAIRQATVADLDHLARIRAACFGVAVDQARDEVALQMGESGSRLYLAELAGEPVGTLGALVEADGVYLRGLGVLPEFQGRGFGRGILSAISAAMIAEGHTHLSLDVATGNRNALALYLSCGFVETNRYDYFEVDLSAGLDP